MSRGAPTTDRRMCPEAGARRCARCQHWKAPSSFTPNPRPTDPDRLHSWCRGCVRRGLAEYRQTEAYRAWLKEYLARPEVKERKRAIDRKRSEARKARQKAARATPLSRVLHCRRQARIKLRRAATPERRRALEELIAAYDREIERMRMRSTDQ